MNQKSINTPFLLDISEELSWTGVRLFFTTRSGGVSQGPYEGLNLGMHVGDDQGRVHQNRIFLSTALGVAEDHLVLVEQVHGVDIIEAQGPSSGILPEADGLITKTSGLAIGVMTADCAPILIGDPDAGAVGALHAGWRGAFDGIAEAGVARLVQIGARLSHTRAVIGPCIHQDAYVVDAAVHRRFLDQAVENAVFFRPSKRQPDGFQFDLPGYVRRRLMLAGISEENIHDLSRCSYAEPEHFFSHRRSTERGETPCGRQISGIILL